MKLLREPLFHFLVLGAGLFALFGLVDDSEGTRTDRIVVTTGQIQRLAEGWTRTWQRPPTQAELDGIAQRLAEEYPGTNAGTGARVVLLREQVVQDVRSALMLLLGAVALVLGNTRNRKALRYGAFVR